MAKGKSGDLIHLLITDS